MLKTFKIYLALLLSVSSMWAQSSLFETDNYKIEFYSRNYSMGQNSETILPENMDQSQGYLLRDNHDGTFDYQINQCKNRKDSSSFFYRIIFKKNLNDYSINYVGITNSFPINDDTLNLNFYEGDSISSVNYQNIQMLKVNSWTDTENSITTKLFYDNQEILPQIIDHTPRYPMSVCNGYINPHLFRTERTVGNYVFGQLINSSVVANSSFYFSNYNGYTNKSIVISNTSLIDSLINVSENTFTSLQTLTYDYCNGNYFSINFENSRGDLWLDEPTNCLKNGESVTLNSDNNIPVYWFKDSLLIASNTNQLLVSQSGEYYYSLNSKGYGGCDSNSNKITFKKCCSFNFQFYNDSSNYDVRDTHERNINSVKVSIPSLGLTYFSDENGVVNIDDLPETKQSELFLIEKQGFETIQLRLNLYEDVSKIFGYYYIPTINSFKYIVGNNQIVIGLNKGFEYDASIQMYSSVARPGFNFTSYLHVSNNGKSNISGTVTLEYSSPFYNKNIDTEETVTNTVKQQIYSFSTNSKLTFNIVDTLLKTITTVPLGQNVCFKAYITCAEDENQQNDTIRYCVVTRGSFDPNDIAVSPQGPSYEDQTLKNTDLDYTIRFQNTGTDTAFTVVVKDTLPNSIDVSSITMLNASHNYNLKVNGNIATWTFNNILLLDSTSNEPKSHGFIQYRVKQKPNLTASTVILNRAGIYFDFNAPVITNTSSITIVDALPLVISNINNEKIESTMVYPNPVSDVLMVESNSVTNFKLIDYTGRVILNSVVNGKSQIDISEIEPGVYFYSVDGRKNQKLIIK